MPCHTSLRSYAASKQSGGRVSTDGMLNTGAMISQTDAAGGVAASISNREAAR